MNSTVVICGKVKNNELGERVFDGVSLYDGTLTKLFVLAEFVSNEKKYIVLCDSLFPTYNSKVGAYTIITDGRNSDYYLTPVGEYDDLKVATGVINAICKRDNSSDNMNGSTGNEDAHQDIEPVLFFIDEDTVSNKLRLRHYILKTMRKYQTYSEMERELISSVVSSIIFDDRMLSDIEAYWKRVFNTIQYLSDESCLAMLNLTEEEIPVVSEYVESNSIAKRVKDYIGNEVYYTLTLSNSIILKQGAVAKHLLSVKALLIKLKYSTLTVHPEPKDPYKVFLEEWPPARIVRYLSGNGPTEDNNGIINQEEACEAAAFLLYNHIKRLSNGGLKSEKENYMFIGPTGSGKTALFKRLSNISPEPILFIDAASLVEVGYQGLSKDDVLTSLVSHLSRRGLEKSILVIDEADKVFTPSYDGKGRDVHKQVQSSLLKLFENGKVVLQSKEVLDTSRITIVLLGAFEGIEDMLEKETHVKLGFLSDIKVESEKSQYEKIREALTRYGAMPEIIGRVTYLVEMSKLSKDALNQIAIQQTIVELESMYAADGITITFRTDEILTELDAIRIIGGARGIKSILFPVVAKKLVKIIGKANPKAVEITGQDIHKELYDKS